MLSTGECPKMPLNTVKKVFLLIFRFLNPVLKTGDLSLRCSFQSQAHPYNQQQEKDFKNQERSRPEVRGIFRLVGEEFFSGAENLPAEKTDSGIKRPFKVPGEAQTDQGQPDSEGDKSEPV